MIFILFILSFYNFYLQTIFHHLKAFLFHSFFDIWFILGLYLVIAFFVMEKEVQTDEDYEAACEHPFTHPKPLFIKKWCLD